MKSGNRAGKDAEIAAAVDALAPPAPPCFGARDIWRRYLASAIDVQTHRAGAGTGPLLLGHDGKLRWDRLDPAWSFCRDCTLTPIERQNLINKNDCRPQWWRENVPALTDDEAAPRTNRHQGRRVIPITPAPQA